LRPQTVTVRITFRESDRITPAQLALAQAIAAVASDLSLAAEPDRLQVVQLWVAHAADVAALAAGGRMVDDSHAPDRWTIASPDNHGVDIAGWADDHDGWASVSG
jgi:4a-hydroxytetrahydrobiopterin dehydratase